MALLPWTGKTEEVLTLRLIYQSGETQLVRWVRQWDAEQLEKSIAEAHALEAKRTSLLASYRQSGASDQHPAVVFLLGADKRKHVYRLMTWELHTWIFDVPSRGNLGAVGLYEYELSRIEIVARQKVIAHP